MRILKFDLEQVVYVVRATGVERTEQCPHCGAIKIIAIWKAVKGVVEGFDHKDRKGSITESLSYEVSGVGLWVRESEMFADEAEALREVAIREVQNADFQSKEEAPDETV